MLAEFTWDKAVKKWDELLRQIVTRDFVTRSQSLRGLKGRSNLMR